MTDTTKTSTLRPADLPLQPADILLPAAGVNSQWCVIAADQFTASPEYWQKVAAEVGERPSTLHMILPEIYLQNESAEEINHRVVQAQAAMRDYLAADVFATQQNAVIYLERKTSYVDCRKSLLLALDLESYTYLPVEHLPTDAEGAQAAAQIYDVRASEATVLERIPPREKVRSHALLELPHVQVLFDDPQDAVFSAVAAAGVDTEKPLYRTELMLGGGSVCAWKIAGESELWSQLADLLAQTGSPDADFRFIVGDGNHSLAAAKSHWEKLKAAGASFTHPARYALVELINVHDPGLTVEPIHRLLRGISLQELTAGVQQWNERQGSSVPREKFVALGKDFREQIEVARPSELLVEALQEIIDEIITSRGLDAAQACDYIHGEAEVRRLTATDDAIGILLPALNRSALFTYVAHHGTMPRKSFSLGEAEEKRYYCECRAIVP